MNEALSVILRHASQHVGAYSGLRGDSLEEFPIVAKWQYREYYDRYLSFALDPSIRRWIIEAKGRAVANRTSDWKEIRDKGYVLERSTGTSGPPVWYPRALAERTRAGLELAALRRRMNPEYNPQRFLDLQRMLEGTAENERTTASLIARVRDLRERIAGPVHLYGNVSLVRNLANEARRIRWVPRAAVVELAGERAAPEAQAEIQTAFEVPLISQYGTRESWAIGYSFLPDETFTLSGGCHVELVDGSDRLISVPGVLGRIVVTSLIFRAFPIIRFETGDHGCWIEDERGKRLRLEQRRPEEMFMVRWISYDGAGFFGDVIESCLRALAMQPTPWRVIQQNQVVHIYLSAATSALKEMIACKLFELCDAGVRIEFHSWSGWGIHEKRYPFLRKVVSSPP